MSTGAECNFWEVEPGRWKYRLQLYPYGETDEFDEYGPFSSFRSAREHLDRNHANPGGWSTRIHETDHKHEWSVGPGQKKTGITIRIDVDSLGPDVELADAIRYIQTLAPDHAAWQSWPHYGWVDNINSCDACGAEKEVPTDAR